VSAESGVIANIQSSDVTMTFPDSVMGLSYTSVPDFIFARHDLAPFPLELRLGDAIYAQNQIEFDVIGLFWGAGSYSTVMSFEIGNGIQDWVVELGGDALPTIASP
jgi:hypothetical protein